MNNKDNNRDKEKDKDIDNLSKNEKLEFDLAYDLSMDDDPDAQDLKANEINPPKSEIIEAEVADDQEDNQEDNYEELLDENDLNNQNLVKELKSEENYDNNDSLTLEELDEMDFEGESEIEDDADDVTNDIHTSEINERVKNKKSNKYKKDNNKNKLNKNNRKARNTSVISVIVLAAILLVLNIMLEQIGGNHLRFDWTQNKVATIGEKSKQILGENKKKINFTVLANKDIYASMGQNQMQFMPKLLEDYQSNSKGNINLEYIDPVQDPAIVTKLDPKDLYGLKQGQLIISNEDNSKLKVLNPSDLFQYSQDGRSVEGYNAEDKISGAIKYVLAEYTPKVLVTTGHNETLLENGYTGLKALLENNNFQIEQFSATTDQSIPEDTKLIMMVNPQNDINALEVEVYMKYLKKGGNLLVMADYATTDFPNLNKVLAEFNIKLTNDLVKENASENISERGDIFQAKINNGTIYPESAPLNNIVLANTRVITTADNSKDYVKVENIIETTDQATKLIGGAADNESRPGKLSIGMYSKHSGWMDMSTVKEPSQVAVFGTSLAFSDQLLSYVIGSAGNNHLAYFSIAQMADLANNQVENLLIAPKPIVSYRIVPNNQNIIQVVAFSLSIGLPILLLIVAMVVNRRRRNL